ncbi:MAG TPA: choice-of-anchor D domain-containing protein [Usitatibacter sp.]|jgi:hypothetical protein|nr:choice-of-anchor D domain-containing protein [Usitatibacter sp.]
MRTPHRAPALSPAHRKALAVALGVLFGSGAASAATIDVPGTGAAPLTLSQAISNENAKFATGAGDCSADTIVIAAGFTVADSAPLPTVTCPGLTIAGAGTFPNGATISGINSFSYGGCGLESAAQASIGNIEISGFTYGAGLCGHFDSITASHIHDNGFGIDLFGGSTTAVVGGGAPGGAASNYIYGNINYLAAGIIVEYGGSASISGNFIGTPDGKNMVPNGSGVIVQNGATASVDDNVVAESFQGIDLFGSGSVTNNRIGVDPSGTSNLGSGGEGIVVSTIDPNVRVSGNTIANMGTGIAVGNMTGGQIASNGIGVTSAGAPLANSGVQDIGITVACSTGVQLSGNTIGGQQSAGVLLAGTSATTLDSNHIGVGADGTTRLNNGSDGVALVGTCALGTAASAAIKRASASVSPFFRMASATSGNTFLNNDISYNSGYGIDIPAGSTSGDNLVQGNRIANNGASGVGILDSSSIGNAIIGNAIFGNAPKNIELAAGANEGIASPQIQSVVQVSNTTVVTYQVNAPTATPQNYTIEFFTNPAGTQPAGTTFQRQVYQAGVQGLTTFTETFAGALDNFSLTSTLSSAPGGWIETSELSPVGVATVVAPAITFSPVSTDFGGVYVNQHGAAHTITATNGSANPVGVSAPSLTGPFTISSTDCGATLAPHASCSVDVAFAPDHSGLATGVLSLGTFTSSLTGNGLDAPILDVTGLIDFGIFIAGSPAAARTATLANTGSAVVTIDSITVSGPFGMSNDCPINLVPGASCTLTVSFGSSQLGTAAGIVTINSNALGGARTIALGALVQLRPEPVIEFHPDSLTFGNTRIGSQGPSMRVIISNSGGVAATLGAMRATSDYVIVGTTCTASLAPQATCTTDVALSPIGFGSRPGALTFTSNADGSPHKVGLGGTGCHAPGLGANRGGPPDPCLP